MLNLIVAKAKNNAIGKNGKIPWSIPEELQYFKEKTINNVVIMGRKTYESIGHPLSQRINIVISNTKKYSGENLYIVSSLNDALELANRYDKEVFIIGGERLYKETMDIVDRMYITEVFIDVKEADTFFPAIDNSKYDIDYGKILGNEIKYRKDVYIRRR